MDARLIDQIWCFRTQTDQHAKKGHNGLETDLGIIVLVILT